MINKVFFVLLIVFLFCACKEEKPVNNITVAFETQPTHTSFALNSRKTTVQLLQDSLLGLPIHKFSHQQITELLTFIKAKDQEEREKFTKILLRYGWKEANKQVDFSKNDTLCRNVFDKIVATVGFPDNKRFGTVADCTVFLILAHSQVSYQMKYIDEWEKAAKSKITNTKLFADIKDRTLIATKSWQLYATQHSQKDSLYLPIKDIKYLNQRRMMMGLPVLDINKIKQTNL